MAELYSEGRPANQETAEEIINRLEKSNYIPPSYLTRKEYAHILLQEYREYLHVRTYNGPEKSSGPR